MCEQFDASVILTLLNVTLFFENGDQNAVSPGRWYALSGHDSVEKFAKCHHSQLSQAFPYLHWYLVATHILATLHPSQCSLSVSASLTGLVMPWLGALSSVSTRGFYLFMSQLKTWPHRSMMNSSFISTSPVALLMVLSCSMSFPALSLAAAILQTYVCPSLVSMLSYSPSIASAFTLATTFFAVDFASLYSFLSLSALVRFQIFSLSFFSLTAFSVSSFHHQL